MTPLLVITPIFPSFNANSPIISQSILSKFTSFIPPFEVYNTISPDEVAI